MTRRYAQSTDRQAPGHVHGRVWWGILLMGAFLAGCGHASDIQHRDGRFFQPSPPQATLKTYPTVATYVGSSVAASSDGHADHTDDDGLRPGVEEMDEKRSGELYTFAVNNMPVRDFVAGLARDAKMNVDVYPGMAARITLSVVDQTLPQILKRVARQAKVHCEIRDNVIILAPDRSLTRIYQVDYVNPEQGTEKRVKRKRNDRPGSASDVLADGAGGSAKGQFWEALTRSVQSILNQDGASERNRFAEDDSGQRPGIVSLNQDAGVLTIHATSAQHAQIKELIDRIQENAQRQVLIESTVVEVELNDRYQDGVDWAYLASTPAGVMSGMEGPGRGAGVPFFPLPMRGNGAGAGGNGSVTALVQALNQFGAVKVLSNPKIMAMNNQTAVLKVVENKIYFSLSGQGSGAGKGMYDSQVHTVPVGLVMRVTPQIDAQDVVSMKVRPTISSISRWVNDPNPGLVRGNTLTGVESPNPVPEIRVREMESMLRVRNGQVAVLGGLMQERMDKSAAESTKAQDIPLIGGFFTKQKEASLTKTETVIFLRPVVVSSRRGKGGGAPFAGEGVVLETPTVQKITPAMPPPPGPGVERAPEVGRISPAQRPQSLRMPDSALSPAPPHAGVTYLDFSKPGTSGGSSAGGGFTITRGKDLLPDVPGGAPASVSSFAPPAVLAPEAARPSVPGASGSSAVRGNFYLELGAFTDKANANELHQRVSKSGLPAFQESADVNGKSFQRVRSGPYPTLAEAEQAQARVASETGIQAKVASY
ncbi:MAG: SPOR domain-containing protein [Magnetococcales bacterium]|nr:SPOR domain-containing protein [Magnetococcales bacterium]